MALRHEEHYSIPKSEATPCYALKPFHLLNMLQDAADGAVDAMSSASEWPDECSWMVRRYSIRLTRPLKSGDEGLIRTGHCAVRDLYSIRRFRFYDAENNRIGEADSEWIFVNLETRRPQRLSRTMPQCFYKYVEEESFTGDFKKLSAPSRIDSVTHLHVRLGELDVNGHVNNAYYLTWAAESVTPEVYLNCGITEAHIFYKHEAKLGMDLVIETERNGLRFTHAVKSGEGELLALVETTWTEITD